MYVRMVIGETFSAHQVAEFGSVYRNEIVPEITQQPGFHAARLIVEDGGTMAISLTEWNTREDCLKYHSSRSYRQFVEKTRHLLIGDFVVKLFKEAT